MHHTSEEYMSFLANKISVKGMEPVSCDFVLSETCNLNALLWEKKTKKKHPLASGTIILHPMYIILMKASYKLNCIHLVFFMFSGDCIFATVGVPKSILSHVSQSIWTRKCMLRSGSTVLCYVKLTGRDIFTQQADISSGQLFAPMRPLIGQLSANQQETGRKSLGDPWTVIGSSLSEKSRKKQRKIDRQVEMQTLW